MLRAMVDGRRIYLFDRFFPLRLLGRGAITLGRCVFFREHRSRVSLRHFAHEMLHWELSADVGFLRFAWTYLRDLMRHGYRKHPEEQRAYSGQLKASERTAWRALYDAWRGHA